MTDELKKTEIPTVDASPVPATEQPRIIFGRQGKPPAIEGRNAVTAYLLMLLTEAINARKLIQPWDEAKLGADRAIFQQHNQAKDMFWLRFGCAAGAIDLAMSTKQIDDGTYEKLRSKLDQLLLSSLTGL